jgi:hypothetical protein
MPGKEINIAETSEYIEVIPQLRAATYKYPASRKFCALMGMGDIKLS